MIYNRYHLKDVGQKHIPKLAENPQILNLSFESMSQTNYFKGNHSNILSLSRFIPKRINTLPLNNKHSNAIYPDESTKLNKK